MSIGIRKTFNLDMVPGGAPPVIHVSAEDVGRPYRINLLYNGEVYEAQGNRLTIAGTKPDGTVFEYPVDDFEQDESYADFTIKAQMAIVPGMVRCKLWEYLNDDKIGSATFILDVDEYVYDPEAASETYIPSVEAAIEEAVEAVNEAADRAEAAAECMMAYNTDRTPYLLRQSGGGVETGDREYDTIVGGTVVWNQLIDRRTASITASGMTLSVGSNHELVLSGTPTGQNSFSVSKVTIPFIKDHVYMLDGCPVGGGTSTYQLWVSSDAAFPVGNRLQDTGYTSGSSTSVRKIKKASASSTGGTVLLYFYSNLGETSNLAFNPHLFDLTAMFGSTIADYIYTLEQNTAGAGVAWFRNLFPKPYYEYNAGELKSVSGVSAHVMRDTDDNIIGNYPLDDSLTLRGLPKLNGGKLYYDGDTYEADGTVNRRYGVVDLGTLNWTLAGSGRLNGSLSGQKAVDFSMAGSAICTKYPVVSNNNIASVDKSIAVGIIGTIIQVNDSAYNNGEPSAFKSAMSGVYLVYELATPTTETAEPFANPQVVDPDGTEQYVTDSIVPVGHDTRYQVNLASKLDSISDYVAETVNEYLEEHPEAIVGVVDGSVTTAKIATGAVDASRLANSAVSESKLQDGAVTSAKIADGAVTSAKIDDGAVTGEKIDDGAITSEKVDPDFLESIVNYFVTPQEYGAKADGTTDDSTAIQSAINDGRAVFFPAGTYKISSTIILSDIQNKKIDASNAKFVYDGNDYAFKVTKAQNCDIHFGAIDSTNGGNIKLVADSSSNFIQYCTFHFTYLKCVSGGINVNAEQTNGGWINEIKWFGGRFYGVNSKNFNLIHSTPNDYMNGWAFYNIGFEGATTCLHFNSTVAVGSTGFITDFNFYGCRYIEGFTNFIVVEAGRVENLNFYDSVNPPWGKMTTTEYCTGWNYYPGNASVVKLRHNKWFREVTQKSLLGGGYVTNGDNFNTYLYAGNFVVSSNSIAGSLSNCPSSYAGKLTVENLTGYRLTDDDATSKYLNQTYADTNGDIWIRRLIVTNSTLSTVGTWKKFTLS